MKFPILNGVVFLGCGKVHSEKGFRCLTQIENWKRTAPTPTEEASMEKGLVMASLKRAGTEREGRGRGTKRQLASAL